MQRLYGGFALKLSEICIKHPVLATVLSLVILVFGISAYQKLDLRFFPSIKIPMVSIRVHYTGASPKLMESAVTNEIENALAGVKGIESIVSGSSTSNSSITVMFHSDGDFEQEVSDLRDRVSGIRSKLPPLADPPTITVGATTWQSLLTLGFVDKKRSAAELRNYVERYIYPILQQVPGVGAIGVYGGSDYAMRIWLDSAKMTSLGITVTDISNALQSNNIDFPAGSIQFPTRNYAIVSKTRLTSAQGFADIIIKHESGRTIRFKDIAKVELGNWSLQQAPIRLNGKDALLLNVFPLQGANPITVADEIKKAFNELQPNLPHGMTSSIVYDQSVFLKNAIHDTFKAIIEAVILVILIVSLFLGSIRASIIPIVTIPVCLIGVFAIMFLFGFTVNTMSLLAMVLAIGLVVDDAIVMLENIHRHIEDGLSPFQASIIGSKEISLTVVAMALTLAAVYAPIGFAYGFTAEILKEFAFTLAGTVIISGFTALTLSPMLCSKILQTKKHDNKFVYLLDNSFEKLSGVYQKTLTKILHKKIIVIISLLIIAGIGAVIYKSLASEFIPKEDTSLIQTTIISPSGSNLNYTDKYAKNAEKIIEQTSGIKNLFSIVYGGSASITTTLKDTDKRKKNSQQITNELAPKLNKIPGVNTSVTVPDPIQYGVGGWDVSFHLMTAGEYEDLQGPTNKMVAILKKYSGLQNVHTDLKYDSQQYNMTINRELAAMLGVNIQDIANTVSVMLGGLHLTDVQSGNRSYAVLLQMQKKDLENFRGFKKLYVRNDKGEMIPVSSLVTLTPVIGQPSLGHYNRMRSSIIVGNLSPGYVESDAINYINSVLPKILTTKVRFTYSEKALQYIQSRGGMFGIFLMSFIFIYLVLSAQFGSFIDPFIILFAVPLSIVGALLALKLSGGTLSLYSQIGLITLVGLISKHGILITQFTNQLRKQGMTLNQAIVKAAAIRLRPILMTTSAMIFGSLPLALATGAGSVGHRQIGWVIVGGLFFGTFFSLIVVPIAYSYLGKWKKFDIIELED